MSGAISVVVTRHVIEHVPDPVEFLSVIRNALPDAWHGSLFIETPCARWIINNRAMHDFFYEHVNYSTAKTLSLACHRAGFRATEVNHVFCGQYLWAENCLVGDGRVDFERIYGSSFRRGSINCRDGFS